MKITPRGMSVQEAYRLYRDGEFLVNRRYQRKLVWTVEEKRRLIDSMLQSYPIPLILLAEHKTTGGTRGYEIIDGMQRLNAVFTFIENAYDLNGSYFSVAESTRARLAAEAGSFVPASEDLPKLERQKCADLLDYQLAVTIYPPPSDEAVNEVFRRINANGRQLSTQERRQAGVVSSFADVVRVIASELRGDVSQSLLSLTQMPEISIESKKTTQGYGIQAEDTLWCSQGILTTKMLRESDDEDMIADILASLLLKKPIARSRELLDELYDPATDDAKEVEAALAAYGQGKLSDDIKGVFSTIRRVVEDVDPGQNALRRMVASQSASSIKTPFYTIVMAFLRLMVEQQKSPADSPGIMKALGGLAAKLATARHYTTEEDRHKNINLTVDLLDRHFVKKEPPDIGHGPALAMDFENSLRRSRIESSRYEFKQGLLRLDNARDWDDALISRIAETICGIANLGPESTGYLYIGVADKVSDAQRVKELDGLDPIQVGDHYVVGVDREAVLLRKSLDDYVKRFAGQLRDTELSEPVRSHALGKLDPILYKGRTVLRVTIPGQKSLSDVGERFFTREGSETKEVEGKQLLAVSQRFATAEKVSA